MPRIRSIKPDFFTSEDVSVLPFRARLTWIGLWTHCDDHGRTKDVGRLIKAAVWPLDDVSLGDVEQDLITLADAGRIVRYSDAGKGFLAVVNWHAHQAISKPSKARHPAPPRPVNPTDPTASGYCAECAAQSPGSFPDGSRNPPGALPLGKEGNGKEGTREGTSPGSPPDPTRCPKHQRTATPPPCGACADARRTHQAKPTNTPSRPECPIHPGQPTGSVDCPKCATETAPAPDLKALLRNRTAS